MLSFTEKVKSVNTKVPEKVKIYIEKILKEEINYFENKFKTKIAFLADPQLIIPEYSINLLDKKKKTVNKIENINQTDGLKEEYQKKIEKPKGTKKNKITKKTFSEKKKKDVEKKSKKKSPRTLWTRRKKKAA